MRIAEPLTFTYPPGTEVEAGLSGFVIVFVGLAYWPRPAEFTGNFAPLPTPVPETGRSASGPERNGFTMW